MMYNWGEVCDSLSHVQANPQEKTKQNKNKKKKKEMKTFL